jgi:integrase
MARPKRKTPWLEWRDGIAYANWYDDIARRTKRLSLRTTDSDEAQARFAEFLLNGHEIRNQRPKGALTVRQALDHYLKEHVYKKCVAYERQEQAIAHLKEFFGDRPLATIDVPLSREYAAARAAGEVNGGKKRRVKVISPSTVRRELNVLVAASNHAIWMKRTTEGVSVDKPKEKALGQDDEAPCYTRDELARIFAAAETLGDDMELFVKLLYYTGARRRSIEHLEREQVKLPERRILLQKPGKRATKKRQPIVPILSNMVPLVERLLETGGPRRLFKDSDYYRPYRRLLALAEVTAPGKLHPHVMRHSRATHLLQDGKSIYDVARLLGDTVATVDRVYGHNSAEHLATALVG